MSGTTFKKRDKNRYRKIYRYLRKKPSNTFYFDKPTIIEAHYIDFDGTSTTGTYTCTQIFAPNLPYVTATAVDSESNSQADVNVFISSVANDPTTLQTVITVEISQLAECRAHFHAIWIGS